MRPILLTLLFALATPALASDGVIELNHACAANTGCLTGDTAGYPVTIYSPGSYRLTSDLTPSNSADAVVIDAIDVSIDLNGFRLLGNDNGTGIAADGANFVTVRNGTVRDFSIGIELGQYARVENVTVASCSDGVYTEAGGLLIGNHIVENVTDGITVSADTILRDNVIRGSSTDRNGGITLSDNHCSDGSCSSRPRLRRVYLTTTYHDGSQAGGPVVCARGYHFASFSEIFDPSTLEYEESLGQPPLSAGSGILDSEGWIRTPENAPVTGSSSTPAGLANCTNWSSASGSINGSVTGLATNWDEPATMESPWRSGAIPCNVLAPVWCVEN